MNKDSQTVLVPQQCHVVQDIMRMLESGVKVR